MISKLHLSPTGYSPVYSYALLDIHLTRRRNIPNLHLRFIGYSSDTPRERGKNPQRSLSGYSADTSKKINYTGNNWARK